MNEREADAMREAERAAKAAGLRDLGKLFGMQRSEALADKIHRAAELCREVDEEQEGRS